MHLNIHLWFLTLQSLGSPWQSGSSYKYFFWIVEACLVLDTAGERKRERREKNKTAKEDKMQV